MVILTCLNCSFFWTSSASCFCRDVVYKCVIIIEAVTRALNNHPSIPRLDTPLSQSDIVSVLATRDASGHYSVTNTSGLLVLRPDHLISSTSVVAGVFCKRKAVLQERWRGIDSANMAVSLFRERKNCLVFSYYKSAY